MNNALISYAAVELTDGVLSISPETFETVSLGLCKCKFELKNRSDRPVVFKIISCDAAERSEESVMQNANRKRPCFILRPSEGILDGGAEVTILCYLIPKTNPQFGEKDFIVTSARCKCPLLTRNEQKELMKCAEISNEAMKILLAFKITPNFDPEKVVTDENMKLKATIKILSLMLFLTVTAFMLHVFRQN